VTDSFTTTTFLLFDGNFGYAVSVAFKEDGVYWEEVSGTRLQAANKIRCIRSDLAR